MATLQVAPGVADTFWAPQSGILLSPLCLPNALRIYDMVLPQLASCRQRVDDRRNLLRPVGCKWGSCWEQY